MRLWSRSYITPTQRKSAPEMNPCEIIWIRAPSTPRAALVVSPVSMNEKTMKNPRVTNPMCDTDEYAISFFMSGWTRATNPMYTIATSESAIMNPASSALASGAIGMLSRTRP